MPWYNKTWPMGKNPVCSKYYFLSHLTLSNHITCKKLWGPIKIVDLCTVSRSPKILPDLKMAGKGENVESIASLANRIIQLDSLCESVGPTIFISHNSVLNCKSYDTFIIYSIIKSIPLLVMIVQALEYWNICLRYEKAQEAHG